MERLGVTTAELQPETLAERARSGFQSSAFHEMALAQITGRQLDWRLGISCPKGLGHLREGGALTTPILPRVVRAADPVWHLCLIMPSWPNSQNNATTRPNLPAPAD